MPAHACARRVRVAVRSALESIGAEPDDEFHFKGTDAIFACVDRYKDVR